MPSRILYILDEIRMGATGKRFSPTDYYNWVLPEFIGRNHNIKKEWIHRLMECQYLDTIGGGVRKYVVDSEHNRRVLGEIDQLEPFFSRRLVYNIEFESMNRVVLVDARRQVEEFFEFVEWKGMENFITAKNTINLMPIAVLDAKGEPKLDDEGNLLFTAGVDLSKYYREGHITSKALIRVERLCIRRFMELYEKRHKTNRYDGRILKAGFLQYGVMPSCKGKPLVYTTRNRRSKHHIRLRLHKVEVLDHLKALDAERLLRTLFRISTEGKDSCYETGQLPAVQFPRF